MPTDAPKTWLASDIQALIEAEIKAYRHECNLKRQVFSSKELAELIYVVMDEKGLVEHQP